MNPRYPMKRLPSEPTRVSVSTLRSTPNFKASHTTHTDEHTESDYSQEIPFAHKSFDVSTGLTSRAFLKPNTSNIQQRRPSSGKKERPTEPVRGGSFDALLSGPDSHRKITKPVTTTNPVNKDITKTFQHKISEMAAAAATSQRSLSQRDKPFFAVPITDLNRKNSQEIRPQIGSSRDRDRTEEEYSTRIANLESFTLSPTKVLGKYQSLVKSYEELMNRNKQAEESLRLEVIRGEEQRAYIEMLKRVIEENKNKPCQFCILREQKHSQDGHRSDRKSDNILNTEVESLRANEGRLIQDIETFRDRLQDANTEKEMMVAQLGHSQETVDKLNSEIRRLKESLLAMQKEASKIKEENSVLTEQVKHQGSANECEKLRKELKELQSNYEDLKVLSGEIENQRKMGTKMLEEEIRERRKAEVENKDMREKLNQVDNVIEVKEKEKAELEKMVEEERMLVKELQQKLEVLEDNYSTLRMTLNENENELEKLKSEQENSKGNEEEVSRLQEENSKLKEKLEEVQKSMAEEKARLRNGYESNQKRLSKLSEDLRSAYSTNEKVMEECQLLKSEKNILFQKVENLEEAQRKSQRNSMVLGVSSNASDIVKKYEDRERVLRMLKDQVNLLEKENSLLKNSQETSRQRNATTEKMKDENAVLQQRNEVITKKFQELKGKWELLRTEHSQALHEVGQLREDIGRIEGELTEIVETYLPQEDLIDTGALSAREITEEDYGRISRLMQNVKKKIERLNERYNQAKLDLVREMERCVEIERENDKESVLKRENMALREKLERMSQEFVEVDKEKSLLKISNENLLQKFSHVNMQVQTLKKELEGMHNKENHITSTRRSLIDHSDPINSDIKLKDAMIKRLEAFVFNLDVKELLEEMLHIETRILKLSKTKEKVPLRHSMRSTSTLDPTERKENSFLESRSTMKGDVDDMTEELEIQKAKRDTLENELSKLEEQERKRYDSLSMLEKQNFELKSEISRLMTELEINFSEYKDSKSEYYSRKMNERFMFSNGGYDFALEGLEHKGHKDGTISDFHMDYSMEKISGEDAEDPYYS